MSAYTKFLAAVHGNRYIKMSPPSNYLNIFSREDLFCIKQFFLGPHDLFVSLKRIDFAAIILFNESISYYLGLALRPQLQEIVILVNCLPIHFTMFEAFKKTPA